MADGIKNMVSKGLGVIQKNRSYVEGIIGEWPGSPKLGAEMMLAKYGVPHEITDLNVCRYRLQHDYNRHGSGFAEQ